MKTKYRILKQEDTVKSPYYYIERKRIIWSPLKGFTATKEHGGSYYMVKFEILTFSTDIKAISYIKSLKTRRKMKSSILRAKINLENGYVYFKEDDINIFEHNKSIRGYEKPAMILALNEKLKSRVVKTITI